MRPRPERAGLICDQGQRAQSRGLSPSTGEQCGKFTGVKVPDGLGPA
jgi:hypothetical protein